MGSPARLSSAGPGSGASAGGRRGSFRRLLAYAAYLVAICCALLELTTRLLRTPEIPVFVASDNPRLVYVLNPERPEINSLGMRGPEIDLDDRGGALTIAAVGDSHTFSVGVPSWELSFPARIAYHLASGSEPVRVLNFGVPGYNTAQELELFESRVVGLSPDWVILQYTVNDSHVCNYLQPGHPRVNAWIHRSAFLVWAWKRTLYSPWGLAHLYDFVGTHAPDLLLYEPGLVGTLRILADEDPTLAGHPPRSPERVPARYHYMLGRESWIRHVRRFGEVARRAGIAALATGFIEPADRGIFADAGFQVLSFYEIFRDVGLESGGYDPRKSWSHFNGRGSDLVGRALARAIRGGAAPAHGPRPRPRRRLQREGAR